MILIPNERHAVGVCINNILYDDPRVKTCSYKVPHPLANDVLIEASGDCDEETLVKDAIVALRKKVDALSSLLDSCMET